MNRRDLFKMIPGLAVLPFLKHFQPKSESLYCIREGNKDFISTAQIYEMIHRSDEEMKSCTGIINVRKPPRWVYEPSQPKGFYI